MADGVDNDLGFFCFVENQIGIGQCRHAPDRWIVHASADGGVMQQKIDGRLNAA